MREHPGAQVVCRDGSAAYAEAIRQGAPEAIQVSDRWHLWHGLAASAEKTVVAHSRCWHSAGPRRIGVLAERTRRKHAQVHTLLDQGLGLGECARRLGWGFNTVKRYARAASADDLLRPPKYGATLVNPYREHLRRRLAEEPGVPVTHLLAEIGERGYTGSANLLVRYLNQGRADPDRSSLSPRRLVSWLMSRPDDLPAHRRRHLEELIPACPHLTALATRVREFAVILTQRRGHDLDDWISTVRADDLPRPAQLRPRPGEGQTGRHRRAAPALQQRPNGRHQHQGQAAETPDVRPSWLCPVATADPPFLTTHCHHRICARAVLIDRPGSGEDGLRE